MKTNLNENKKRLKVIALLMLRRFFPYPHYFIIVFPFFALLISHNVSPENVLSLYPLLPCLFTFMALFTYNELCDNDTDPPEKNLITSGKLLKDDAILFTALFILLAIISAIAIYRSPLTIVVFCSNVFFSLAYSGLKIRFKTTTAGPFVASYILWVAPSLILLTNFSFWNPVAISLLCGIFLVFAAHELHHQIDDYTLDKKMKVKTLALRIGIKKTLLISGIVSSFGFLLVIYSMCLSLQYLYVVLFASLISLFVLFQSVLANTRSVLITGNIPVKLFLATYACIVLSLPLLLTLLILLVFSAEIYNYVQYYRIPPDKIEVVNESPQISVN